jgi:hypothetical protein
MPAFTLALATVTTWYCRTGTMESRAAATQENLGNVSCLVGVPQTKMKYLTLWEHG